MKGSASPATRKAISIAFAAVFILSLFFALIPGPSGNSPASSHHTVIPSAAGHVAASVPYTNPVSLSGRDYHITPSSLYPSEPAPMGIADYGYSPSIGAYSYTSSSFLGTVKLDKLFVYNGSLSSNKNGSSIQLNLNLNFTYGGQHFTYWVQNVAALTSSSDGMHQYVSFVDNVWNFSTSSGSNMYSSTLSGNGTVSTFTQQGATYSYYYSVAGKLPGNNVTLAPGSTIRLKSVSTIDSSGVPEAIMMYNDGSGWTVYDNIYFVFAGRGASNVDFAVSGYNTNSYGLYCDAELIIGGPGGASGTTIQKSSVNMSLQYWNGKNYQYVPEAYNFGSDTGETVSNALVSFLPSISNSSLQSHIVPGTGSTGQIYGGTPLSVLNITLPFQSGTLTANSNSFNFTGSGINLTLQPGEYNLTISPAAAGRALIGTFFLKQGETLYLDSNSFAEKFTVNITESSLPEKSWWGAKVEGYSSNTTMGSFLTFLLQNGTYRIDLNTSALFEPSPSSMTVTVDGKNITVVENFNRLYSVNFYQTGLNGIDWFVNFSGTIGSDLGPEITVLAANGSYNFTVSGIMGYTASPAHGKITVGGGNISQFIAFLPVLYPVTISVAGIPGGVNWSVLIGGSIYYPVNGTITLTLPNGTYGLTAQGAGGGYAMQGGNSTFKVDGSPVNLNLSMKYQFNSGMYAFQKIIFASLLVGLSGLGAMVMRATKR